MKNIMIAGLILATLTALVAVSYLWKLQTADDPLAANKVELQKIRILKDIESLRLSQEREKQESAKLAAKLAREKAEQERQATIQAAAIVVTSRTLAAAGVYVLPYFALFSLMTGAGLFYFFRRVPVETPFVKASLPVRRAAAIVEKSLTVSNAAEMGKALAFQHDISQQQIHSAVEIFRSLRPGRENISINQSALPAAPTQEAGVSIPTFQEILANLEEGDQMVFGYNTETGDPITGDFSRLYSSFIGGRSGSGKTSALRGLILQSLKTTPDIEYLIHDPHSEHKESLAQTLPKCRQIQFTGKNPLPDVRRFAETLQERIDTNAIDAPPLVFVVDELAYCSRQKYFGSFQALFDRISTEGRKCRVYLLASSQDLRFRKTGDFRDTLSSSFLFNLKSGQVKSFTQDNDLVKLHKFVRVANAPGVALLDLTDGDPVIVRTPFCSPDDARFLPLHNLPAARGEEIPIDLKKDTRDEENASEGKIDSVSNLIQFPRMKRDETPMERRETDETLETEETPEMMSDDEIRAEMLLKLETPGASLSGLAAEIGINKGGLHRFLKENQNPSENLRTALASFLGVSTMKQEA